MFSFLLENRATDFKHVLLKIPSSATQTWFSMNDDGLFYGGMDESAVTLSGIKLDGTVVTADKSKYPFTFSVDIENILEALEFIEHNDSITLRIHNENDTLLILETSGQYGSNQYLVPRTHSRDEYSHFPVHFPSFDKSKSTVCSINGADFDNFFRNTSENPTEKYISFMCSSSNGVEAFYYEKDPDDGSIVACEGNFKIPVRCEVIANYANHQMKVAAKYLNCFRQCRSEKNELHWTTIKAIAKKKILDDSILDSVSDAFSIIGMYASLKLEEYWLSKTFENKKLTFTIQSEMPLRITFDTKIGQMIYWVAPILDPDEQSLP